MRNFFALSLLALFVMSCSGQWTDYPVRDENLTNVEQYIEVGDVLNISVFNESNLSGEYPVLGNGAIQIPLLGTIKVQGLTLDMATELIAAKFREGGYLRNPDVTLSVAQSQTVRIMGEVRATGEYPYKSGMTILDLAVNAGGFSYRANQNKFDIVRKGTAGESEKVIQGKLSTQILPGDIVRVKERYF
jgi:polysaccharide export outer membrane protein